MSLHYVTPTGVSGRALASRPKWFCRLHLPRYESAFEAKRLEEEANSYKAKKLLWAEEQERRRLANLDKRKATVQDTAVQELDLTGYFDTADWGNQSPDPLLLVVSTERSPTVIELDNPVIVESADNRGSSLIDRLRKFLFLFR